MQASSLSPLGDGLDARSLRHLEHHGKSSRLGQLDWVKMQSPRSVEGAPGPPDPWGLGGDHRSRSRFVCFKVSQTPLHQFLDWQADSRSVVVVASQHHAEKHLNGVTDITGSKRM